MGVSAGASLLGGLFGSSAAEKAAQQQQAAEQKGINLLNNDQTQGMANYSPYLQAGSTASNTLSSLTGTPGQGLLTPWTQQFTAPTAAQAEATPGYQFQLQQGENAAQNSAAGQGSLLSGRTLASLNNYAQGTASTNYQNTFNNAQTQYQSAYNTFQNNQNNQYSRLMGVAGQGLQAASGAGNLLSNLGGDQASLLGAQGAAQAAGTIGAANAWSGALGGVGNAAMTGTTMMQLGALNGQGGMPGSDSTGFNSSIWGGSPSYMPAGGGGGTAAPYTGLQMPPGSFAPSGM
jgi:hypothetical protein